LVAIKYTTTPIPICGNIVLYTVDVCNISDLAATGVNITDDAPLNFELLSTSINYNSCAAGNLIDGFNLAGGCCVSVTYEYDVSNAPNSFYYDQDVFLSGDGGQIYHNFDGILTSAEDVTVGEINCDSDVVLFSKTPNTTDICEESFVSYTFTIDNQTDVALQNLHFNDVLPSPAIWAAEPYFLNGLSIGTTNITGSQTADFTIAQVEAQTVASFVLDAYLDTWDIFGVLENTATLSDLPNFVGNTLTATAESVNVYATPSIDIPEIITIYDEETASISANIGGGINPIWTTTGSGVLETPNAETTVYVPSQEDIENGFVQFYISTIPTPDFDCGGEEANDSLLLEILPTPIDTIITEPTDTTITTPTDTTNIINDVKALIPNAFSPNEDGINDNFGLIFPTENVSDFYMMVYNRWGNEIFSSNDVAKKWNGSYQNENCEMGIYVYLISFNIDGKRKTYKGNISLIR
jgi:gliding motility-associated-like protein/uncharacterized repeat protein (TIGR01451 family)